MSSISYRLIYDCKHWKWLSHPNCTFYIVIYLEKYFYCNYEKSHWWSNWKIVNKNTSSNLSNTTQYRVRYSMSHSWVLVNLITFKNRWKSRSGLIYSTGLYQGTWSIPEYLWSSGVTYERNINKVWYKYNNLLQIEWTTTNHQMISYRLLCISHVVRKGHRFVILCCLA